MTDIAAIRQSWADGEHAEIPGPIEYIRGHLITWWLPQWQFAFGFASVNDAWIIWLGPIYASIKREASP